MRGVLLVVACTRGVFLVVACLIGFFAFVLLAEAQRSCLGREAGNMAWPAELLIAGALYVGYRLTKAGNVRAGAVLQSFALAGLFLAMGSLAAPEHIQGRAADRRHYWDFYLEPQNVQRTLDPEGSAEAIRADVAARELEFEAVQVRYADPGGLNLRRTGQGAWSLKVIALLLAMNGVLLLLIKESARADGVANG